MTARSLILNDERELQQELEDMIDLADFSRQADAVNLFSKDLPITNKCNQTLE